VTAVSYELTAASFRLPFAAGLGRPPRFWRWEGMRLAPPRSMRDDGFLGVHAVFPSLIETRWIRGPSRTASVTSAPRWAGRQCMKAAEGWAWGHEGFVEPGRV